MAAAMPAGVLGTLTTTPYSCGYAGAHVHLS